MAKATKASVVALADEARANLTTVPTGAAPGPFKRLGLQGLEGIAPILVAALATEEPLLLIGPHGTAKSLLLTRVATALALEFRHYNASLLNFDDLVGFPLPGKDGRLEYVKTPAAVWGAGAVIFDEISRCRPDIQNKLFPIIHERKVQGIALDQLRYRWAAMNPPSTEDDDNGYLGSEPLDAALADRFAFVVEMPAWAGLTEDEQLAIIRADDTPVAPADAQCLADVIARTRASLPLIRLEFADGVAAYVRTLVALLAQAGIALSPRRAGMLFRSVLAVNAAALALDPAITPSDAALLAVRNALPQRAQGIAVPEVKLLAAHRDAWRFANISPGDPLKAILCAADPVERFRLAVGSAALPKGEFSRVVADALAQLRPGAREAAIVHLFETGAVGRLNAAIAGQAAEVYRDVATPPNFSETIHASHTRYQTWSRVKDLLSRLDPAEPRAHLRANALAASFSRKELATPADAEEAFRAFEKTETQLRAA
jgi:MoxR-like ATPase